MSDHFSSLAPVEFEEHATATREAPPLPIEQHIVATALAAERLRSLSEQIILVLRYAPRDRASFDRLQGEALDAWGAVEDHYRAYQALLECKGQG